MYSTPSHLHSSNDLDAYVRPLGPYQGKHFDTTDDLAAWVYQHSLSAAPPTGDKFLEYLMTPSDPFDMLNNSSSRSTNAPTFDSYNVDEAVNRMLESNLNSDSFTEEIYFEPNLFSDFEFGDVQVASNVIDIDPEAMMDDFYGAPKPTQVMMDDFYTVQEPTEVMMDDFYTVQKPTQVMMDDFHTAPKSPQVKKSVEKSKRKEKRTQQNTPCISIEEWLIMDEASGRSRRPLLHEFLRQLLDNENFSHIATYVDRKRGIFKFQQKKVAAELWQIVKGRNSDTGNYISSK